jgi:hypothetical protein
VQESMNDCTFVQFNGEYDLYVSITLDLFFTLSFIMSGDKKAKLPSLSYDN